MPLFLYIIGKNYVFYAINGQFLFKKAPKTENNSKNPNFGSKYTKNAYNAVKIKEVKHKDKFND